jgi:hypothetical protein
MSAPTPRELLDLVIATLPEEQRAKPAKHLAPLVELPYQQVYKWVEAGTDPGAEACLQILDKMGWLKINGGVRRAARRSRDPLESIGEKVAELARGQAKIAATLGVDLAADEPLAAPQKPVQGRPKRRPG